MSARILWFLTGIALILVVVSVCIDVAPLVARWGGLLRRDAAGLALWGASLVGACVDLAGIGLGGGTLVAASMAGEGGIAAAAGAVFVLGVLALGVPVVMFLSGMVMLTPAG
jgi:hypothetical protein